MLSDYRNPISNTSSRLPANYSFGDRLQVPPLRLLQEIIVVNNDIAEPTALSAQRASPPLSVLAANACVSRLAKANMFPQTDAIARVARFIGDNSEYPPSVQHALRGAFYQRWKSISFYEHARLAHAVAMERVLTGQSCKAVAQAHDIPMTSSVMQQLNMLAVDGPAGARAFAGECCYAIAEYNGFELDSLLFNSLQMHAVRGRAGERVRNGESCLPVAEEHGISPWHHAMDMLEMAAVNTCAGERVRKGESCQLVAREHGISPVFGAMGELQNIAVRTVAGARVRQGELCYVVAWDHGISPCHSAMYNLEMVAVETFGAYRVQNGECCALVALSLGIALDGRAVQVLTNLEMASYYAAKRPRFQ